MNSASELDERASNEQIVNSETQHHIRRYLQHTGAGSTEDRSYSLSLEGVG